MQVYLPPHIQLLGYVLGATVIARVLMFISCRHGRLQDDDEGGDPSGESESLSVDAVNMDEDTEVRCDTPPSCTTRYVHLLLHCTAIALRPIVAAYPTLNHARVKAAAMVSHSICIHWRPTALSPAHCFWLYEEITWRCL